MSFFAGRVWIVVVDISLQHMASKCMALRAMLIACVAAAALGQSIRGTVASFTDFAGVDQLAEKKNAMLSYYALAALVIVPTISFIMLYRAKAGGWWGAFGMICCIITALFVYFSVVAFM